MNLDYWLEQVKATTAIAAHLAVPIEAESRVEYLPLVLAPVDVGGRPGQVPIGVERSVVYLPIRLKAY
jgi:hypothetical protein